MDKNGKYSIIDSRLTLESAAAEEGQTFFEIAEGTEALSADAFKGSPEIACISIPASLKIIPDGALSNGDGWAGENRGVNRIEIPRGNASFALEGRCFCRVNDDGTYHLLRVVGSGNYLEIPETVTSIGEKAFDGCSLSEVFIGAYGFSIFFPLSHSYFLSVLLEDFGRSGKLYDFEEYDAFLLRKHFNAERIKMIGSRLEHPLELSDEKRGEILRHVLNSVSDISEFLCEKGTVSSLEDLINIGFFDTENTDAVIEELNRAGKTELKMRLINYKNSNLGFAPQDFEI